jgi:surface protein
MDTVRYTETGPITDINIRLLIREYVDGDNPRNLPPIGSWDVSKVTNMSRLFHGASRFNQDISGWDVSNVTNMSEMFVNCQEFNQPLGNWDVSNVTNMDKMFMGCRAFNKRLTDWNVNNVTSYEYMFDATPAMSNDNKPYKMQEIKPDQNTETQAPASLLPSKKYTLGGRRRTRRTRNNKRKSRKGRKRRHSKRR